MFAVLTSARKALGRLALGFSALALAACQPVSLGGVGGGSGPAVNPDQPVAVALLVPHGAASEQEQGLARALENAARLAVNDIQGAKINLRVYGTAGDVAQAQTAAANAVADGAKIIIGPLRSEAAVAVSAAAAPAGVNVLSFSNTTSVAGGNLFILGQTFDTTADRLAGFAKRQGKSRIVVLHGTDVPGQYGKQAIEKALASNGLSLAGTVGYDLSQEGVAQAIPQIKSTVDTTAADGVFLTANASGALPLLSQMLPEAGVSMAKTQYIGLSRWDQPAQALSLPGLQGGWFALPSQAASAQFTQRYSAAYGTAPHPLAGLAYDGIAAVGALLAQGKSNALSAGSLTQSAGFKGATGIFRFRPDGTNQRGLAVATIRDNKVVVLEPAPRAFGGAGF